MAIYILIGAIFGLTCTFVWSKLPKEYKRPPQTLDEFGWVEHLIMILLWPLCIMIIGYAFITEIIKQFNGKNK
tara:strand:- start:317 stop:535 length:219 start_codon:yes stop_codon:yes gene_type:complete